MLRFVSSTCLAALIITAAACGPAAPADTDASLDDGQVTPDAPIDADGDGYPANVDCDDNDDSIHPGAEEICDDGVDNNCNNQVDTDLECLSACEIAEVQDSYFGCRFYAVDLPQFDTSKLYGISVSNPSSSETATVTISTDTGELTTLQVPPKGLETYQDAARAQNIGTAGITRKALLIESDLPVAAYQFNSLDTINAASTDASLLFAEHSLAKQYFAMDYQARVAGDSFIAVVATEADTEVEITPAAAVNGQTSATLQPFDVMVVTASAAGSSLTGSRISASAPIAVFGGNQCANVPAGMSYCDHIEQQIFPRQAMGTRYVVGKTHARVNCDPPDYIRVMADVDDTTVTFDPPVAGPWNLNAGEWMETTISEPVEIIGSHPILVGQFIRSSNGSECSDEGDPAFILQVPVDQYRRDYIFLTPPTYDTDYVDILAEPGTTVTLDGSAVSLDGITIGASGLSLTSFVIEDGPHVIESNEPIGVVVYGYGGPPASGLTRNVSYGYPAGLDLMPINPVD